MSQIAVTRHSACCPTEAWGLLTILGMLDVIEMDITFLMRIITTRWITAVIDDVV